MQTGRKLLLALIALACQERQAGVGPSPDLSMISVSPPTATIAVAASVQMTATAWDSAGQPLVGRSFTWSSSAPGVATVSTSGNVVGVGAGTATITATSGGKSGSAALTITSVSVASVAVTPAAPSVLTGTTVQLTATVRDAGGNVLTGRPITWRSSDSARARVSTSGLVTGVVVGAATITATSEGRNGTASVTVTQLPVASLDLTPASATILIAGTRQLTATPRDASGNALPLRPVTWSSSDTTKARVSGTGLVTGVGAGTASITAWCEGQTATSLITVNVAPVASVTVTPATPTVLVGNTVQLTATTRDANGTVLTGRVVTWSTSNDTRAQVNSSGLVLGVGAGTATITATSEGRTGSVPVTVTAVPVATVTVAPATSTIAVGGTQQLTATLRDANGNILTGRSITWTSSHPSSRASVSTTGLVTGLGTGTATITATSEGRSGTATVAVAAAPVASVTVTPATVSIAVGTTTQLTATLRDASNNILTGRVVTWTASNASAQVSTSGQVLGMAAGTVTITATSEGQSGSASVTVTATTGQTLLSEAFDNGSLAGRGWYDLGSPVIATAEKHSGTGSVQFTWNQGQTTTNSGVMRHLFNETDRLYLSYWVKYSTNYVGSGQSYHPHEFNFLSNQDQDWDGLTYNYLNLYVEQSYQNGGIPRLAMQDSRMVDITRIGQNLTGITENRSVAGCNGNSDGTGFTTCYQQDVNQWYSAKTWDAPAVAFQPTAGTDYKSNWNHVEVYVQLNTIVGGIGQANGILRYWLNGNLKLELTNVMFRTGANPALKFKQIFIGPYIGDGSPVTQSMWIDDLTIGTARP